MKKLLAVLIIGSIVFAAGCTGSFKLTKSVHKWQTGFENKWVDEVAFLGCLPVYGLTTFYDAIIFNTIEFWTGESPTYAVNLEGDGKSVEMSLREDGSICVSDGQQTLILERTDVGVTAKDASGNVIYRSVKDENNQISVYDASGKLIKRSDS